MVKQFNMPVRSDHCLNFFDFSSTRFDCDEEFKQFQEDLSTTDICNAPCEDIWKKFDDFLLTPPQSPPIRFDLVSDIVDNSDVHDSNLLHNVDVLHDCMWSGQCQEDSTNKQHSHNRISAGRMCIKSRPDTPNNLLSSSPFNMNYSFHDNLSLFSSSTDTESRSSFDEDDDDDFMSSPYDTPISSPSFVKKSLINDHCYGETNRNGNSNKKVKVESQSLIFSSPCHRMQTRSKPKCSKKCSKSKGSKIIKATKVPSTSVSATVKQQPVKPSPKVNISGKVKIIKKSQISSINTTNDKLTIHYSCRNGKNSISSNNIKLVAVNNNSKNNCKYSTRKKTATVILTQRQLSMKQAQQQQQQVKPNFYTKITSITKNDHDKSSHPVRRREHNDSERKRRDHLRNAFLDLKDQIPKLQTNDKRPARIMILHEATQYVLHLNDKHRYLDKTLNAEMERKEYLLRELKRLESICGNLLTENKTYRN